VVQLFADPGDTAFVNPGQAKLFQQSVNLPCAHSLQVSFLDHGQQGFLCWSARFQQAGKIAALAQFGDRQVNFTNSGLSGPFAMAIAVVLAIGRTLVFAGTNLLVYFKFHKHLAQQLYGLRQKIGVFFKTYIDKVLFKC
jgi:hypothetical protein